MRAIQAFARRLTYEADLIVRAWHRDVAYPPATPNLPGTRVWRLSARWYRFGEVAPAMHLLRDEAMREAAQCCLSALFQPLLSAADAAHMAFLREARRALHESVEMSGDVKTAHRKALRDIAIAMPALPEPVDLSTLWPGEDWPDDEMGLAAPKSTMSKEARVLAVLVEHPSWSNEQVAAAAGVNVRSLYRMPRFRTARRVMREASRIPRGSKNRDTGQVEAFDE